MTQTNPKYEIPVLEPIKVRPVEVRDWFVSYTEKNLREVYDPAFAELKRRKAPWL